MTHVMEKKAHEFAIKASKDKELDALLADVLQAGDVKVGATINTMFALLRIYGVDELAGTPKVGSVYDKTEANTPYDKIETVLASGKSEVKYFWNLVADDLPQGKVWCDQLREIADKDGDYAEADDTKIEDDRKIAATKRNEVRKSVKKAKRLFDRLAEINDLPGVRVGFNWDTKPKKSAEPWTGKLAHVLIPVILQDLEDDGTPGTRIKKFGADQVIGFDMAKIKHRMANGKDTFTAIVMREKKDGDGAASVALPDMNMSVSGMTADKLVAWLAKKDTQASIQKAIAGKDERYKATIVALDILRLELNNVPNLAKAAKAINEADRDTEEEAA